MVKAVSERISIVETMMAKSLSERVSIVETKVENLVGKMDDLKYDVKEMHDCLDQTRDLLADKLMKMEKNAFDQHAELGKKITAMEKLKDKWTYTVMGAMVVLSWLTAHADKIIALLK
jgi:conjugal transfer/entry exclusion protein